ncbi:MAG: type II toxin-antitoxin system ParD family antitoxin [Aquisalinus sp.]|nr:type II toxin-antitoxin system ParD family antitoxin [Aquisalinus sp.]
MSMIRKTITISETMEDWVKSRIDSGLYGNDSEYFRDLLRRDQERQFSLGQLRNLIDEGDASGLSERTPQEIMRDVKAKLKASGTL